MTYLKPAPDVDDPKTRPFWDGLHNHVLVVQRCRQCQTLRYPIAAQCPQCLSSKLDWVETTAAGILWSFVVYRRALAATFAEDVPYVVGVVVTDEGLSVTARVDAPPEGVVIGDRMTATFVDVAERVTLLQWTPSPRGVAG